MLLAFLLAAVDAGAGSPIVATGAPHIKSLGPVTGAPVLGDRTNPPIVQITLSILPDGTATDCRVLTSGGSAALDRAACDAALAGSFTPPTDGRPEPWRGWINASASLAGLSAPTGPEHWATRIHAIYPGLALRQHHEGDVRVNLIVGSDGQPRSCDIVNSSGYTELDEAACLTTLRSSPYHPARNARGEPVDSLTEQTIRYRMPAR